MNKKIFFSLIAGLCFSAGALFLAFKRIPLGDISSYLQSIDYLWIIPSAALVYAAFLLRVIRWRTILAASHTLTFLQTYHPLMMGFMLNCVLPARLGELVRPVLLKRNHAIPFTTGIATVAAERLFDMVCLISFLAVIFVTVPMDPDFSYTYKTYTLNRETLRTLGSSMLVFALILVLGIAAITLEWTQNLMMAILRKTPACFSFLGATAPLAMERYFTRPMESLILNIASGFSLVKNPAHLVFCILLSFGIYALHGLSFYLFSLGCPGVDLNFLTASAIMIIICFFIALPSVPGYWGVWEAGGVFSMALFGISGKEAAGYTLVNHAIQIIPVIIFGMVSAVLTSVNIFKLSDAAPASELLVKE
jgi:hypothetical protein